MTSLRFWRSLEGKLGDRGVIDDFFRVVVLSGNVPFRFEGSLGDRQFCFVVLLSRTT